MAKLTMNRGMLGIIAATLVTPVAAQDKPTSFLEEITVTASKRQTNQGFAISCTVFARDAVAVFR